MKTRDMCPETLRALADELERSRDPASSALAGAVANLKWRQYMADLYRVRATRADKARAK